MNSFFNFIGSTLSGAARLVGNVVGGTLSAIGGGLSSLPVIGAPINSVLGTSGLGGAIQGGTGTLADTVSPSTAVPAPLQTPGTGAAPAGQPAADLSSLPTVAATENLADTEVTRTLVDFYPKVDPLLAVTPATDAGGAAVPLEARARAAVDNSREAVRLAGDMTSALQTKKLIGTTEVAQLSSIEMGVTGLQTRIEANLERLKGLNEELAKADSGTKPLVSQQLSRLNEQIVSDVESLDLRKNSLLLAARQEPGDVKRLGTTLTMLQKHFDYKTGTFKDYSDPAAYPGGDVTSRPELQAISDAQELGNAMYTQAMETMDRGTDRDIQEAQGLLKGAEEQFKIARQTSEQLKGKTYRKNVFWLQSYGGDSEIDWAAVTALFATLTPTLLAFIQMDAQKDEAKKAWRRQKELQEAQWAHDREMLEMQLASAETVAGINASAAESEKDHPAVGPSGTGSIRIGGATQSK